VTGSGFTALDAALVRCVDDGELAGVVALAAVDGATRYRRACGRSDIESDRPMSEDALFRIYSMTKPITSVALLMLFEEGRFGLDDPVAGYIPAFDGVQVFAGEDGAGALRLEPALRPISILDLFRHTAGLTYGRFSDTPVDLAYREAGISYMKMPLCDLVDRVAAMPLLHQPGTRWQYSFAHDVQARLIELFSGREFANFLRERIFEPLGMRDTQFGVSAAQGPRVASCYGPDGTGGLRRMEAGPNGDYLRMAEFPAGGIGLMSTADDYLKFAQLLQNGGELDGVRLLRPETVAAMIRNHLPPEAMPINVPGSGPRPGLGYGLGVSVLLDPQAAGSPGSPGQFGWGGSATTSFFVDPAEKLVAVLLAQYMPSRNDVLARFRSLVYRAIGR
jgi:CubicO group peptidase (beta-lactamase class C family)